MAQLLPPRQPRKRQPPAPPHTLPRRAARLPNPRPLRRIAAHRVRAAAPRLWRKRPEPLRRLEPTPGVQEHRPRPRVQAQPARPPPAHRPKRRRAARQQAAARPPTRPLMPGHQPLVLELARAVAPIPLRPSVVAVTGAAVRAVRREPQRGAKCPPPRAVRGTALEMAAEMNLPAQRVRVQRAVWGAAVQEPEARTDR